jgi:hypothetical protein
MKKWYTSTTVIGNILIAIITAVVAFAAPEANTEAILVAAITTILNIINRFRTSEPITRPLSRNYHRGG